MTKCEALLHLRLKNTIMYLIPDKPIISPKLLKLEKKIKKAENPIPQILQEFWKEIEAIQTPLIEKIEEEPELYLVTFLFQESTQTNEIKVECQAFGTTEERKKMIQIPDTDIYYKSLFLDKKSRLTYSFKKGIIRTPLNVFEKKIFPPSIIDPLNKKVIGSKPYLFSILEMPDTPQYKWHPIDESVPKGKIVELIVPKGTKKPLSWEEKMELMKSGNQDRDQQEEGYLIKVYLPPEYTNNEEKYPLGVFFYGSLLLNTDIFHTKNIFNKLIAQKKIPPMIFAMIHHKTPMLECAPDPKFVELIIQHLIPELRNQYNATSDPNKTFIGGQSLSGFLALYMGLNYSEIFGNVLCQSANLIQKHVSSPQDMLDVKKLLRNPTDMYIIHEFVDRPKVELKFYLEVGSYEKELYGGLSMYYSNMYLRDILKLKGYTVTYQEYPSDHGWIQWRESIAEGIIALIGDLI